MERSLQLNTNRGNELLMPYVPIEIKGSTITTTWSAFKILTGTPAGKRSLGRPRRRWEENIKMDFKETGINTRNWVDLVQDRDHCRALVNAALNLRVP